MVVQRSRVAYGVVAVSVMLLGLASRKYAHVLPILLRKNAGDGLWALLVFVLCGLLFPRKNTLWTAGVSLTFSILIEFSQLYHADWIDAIRAYSLGHLILGSGFAWSDMICYAVGIGIGITGE